MSVALPLVRVAKVGPPRPILFSGNQEGSLGGPDLAIPRMGDRFAIDITTDQLQRNEASRTLIAALTQATTDDAIVPLPLINRSRAYAVDGVVDGAEQAGSILKLRSLPAGSVMGWGDFFSIVHSGRRYVHMMAANATVGSDGKVSLPIWPMLRFLTLDGEACELIQPHIEGRLVGFDRAMFSRIRVDPLQFSIVERA